MGGGVTLLALLGIGGFVLGYYWMKRDPVPLKQAAGEVPVRKPSLPVEGSGKASGPEGPGTGSGPVSSYLTLKDQGHVEVANSAGLLDLNAPFTIEMWVRWSPQEKGPLYLAGDEAWPGMHASLPVSSTRGWVVRMLGEPGSRRLDFNAGAQAPGQPEGIWEGLKVPWGPEGEGWQHIAVCRSPREVLLYRNGKLLGKRSAEGIRYVPAPTNLYLGVRANPYIDRRTGADFRAFRISSKARFPAEFTPPAPFRPSAGDLAVLDFTSGGALALLDLTGKGHDGRVTGGTWGEEQGDTLVAGGPSAGGDPTPPPGKPEPPGPTPDPNPPKPLSAVPGIEVELGGDGRFTGDKVGDTIRVIVEGARLEEGKLILQSGRRYRGFRPSRRAPELAREYAANPGAADRKYGARAFVVEGVVTALDRYVVNLSPTKPPAPSAPGARKPDPGQELLERKPDFSVTLDALRAELGRDAKASHQKYGGKVIDLSGTVTGFRRSYSEVPVVRVGGKTDSVGIVCETLEEEPWARLAIGQTVRMRGTLSPDPDSIQFLNCVIADAGPSPAIRTTSEALAAAYAADPAGTNAKHQNKPLLITGEVTTREVDREGGIKITLRGQEGVRVAMVFSPGISDNLADDEVQAGTRARALAVYDSASGGEIRLVNTLFIYGPDPSDKPTP